MLKDYIIQFLKKAAIKRIKLNRDKLIVIAISGSAGKTSTKEAIYHILKDRFRVLASPKNYNNEFGVPLTILEEETPVNIFGWIKVLIHAWQKCSVPLPWQILVLEFGVDKPGDMQYLLEIVRPDIAMLTNIGSVHLEAFPNKMALQEEKLTLLKSLDSNAIAIINQDDQALAANKDKMPCRVMSFGKSVTANIRFTVTDDTPGQLAFAISLPEKTELAAIKTKLLGEYQGYILSAAMTVAHIMRVSLDEAAQKLGQLQPPPGRETLLQGINDTWIIDSTYNSSPEAAKVMLATLEKMGKTYSARQIAVLGDMLELGEGELSSHQSIARSAQKLPIAIFIGKAFRHALDDLYPDKLPDNMHWFASSEELVPFLKEQIKGRDCILFKGSQGIRLEKALKYFLARPELDTKLLIRQEKGWQRS